MTLIQDYRGLQTVVGEAVSELAELAAAVTEAERGTAQADAERDAALKAMREGEDYKGAEALEWDNTASDALKAVADKLRAALAPAEDAS